MGNGDYDFGSLLLVLLLVLLLWYDDAMCGVAQIIRLRRTTAHCWRA